MRWRTAGAESVVQWWAEWTQWWAEWTQWWAEWTQWWEMCSSSQTPIFPVMHSASVCGPSAWNGQITRRFLCGQRDLVPSCARAQSMWTGLLQAELLQNVPAFMRKGSANTATSWECRDVKQCKLHIMSVYQKGREHLMCSPCNTGESANVFQCRGQLCSVFRVCTVHMSVSATTILTLIECVFVGACVGIYVGSAVLINKRAATFTSVSTWQAHKTYKGWWLWNRHRLFCCLEARVQPQIETIRSNARKCRRPCKIFQ